MEEFFSTKNDLVTAESLEEDSEIVDIQPKINNRSDDDDDEEELVQPRNDDCKVLQRKMELKVENAKKNFSKEEVRFRTYLFPLSSVFLLVFFSGFP